MAAGRPVIAFPNGGATETVIPGKTGIFFKDQTWESLFDTVLHFDHVAWDSHAISEYAKPFSTSVFKEKMKRYVEDRYEEFKRGLDQCRLDIR